MSVPGVRRFVLRRTPSRRRRTMRFLLAFFLVALLIAPAGFAQAPVPPASSKAVPRGVILVKGATSSASDDRVSVPEGAAVGADTFESRYFGISYRLPAGW